MKWIAIAVVMAVVGSSLYVKARLFIYRHAETWRRERGEKFGSAPMVLWGPEIYDPAAYVAEGRRLIPIAIALDIASAVLLFVAFTWLVRNA